MENLAALLVVALPSSGLVLICWAAWEVIVCHLSSQYHNISMITPLGSTWAKTVWEKPWMLGEVMN
jgi:hypothetical protein